MKKFEYTTPKLQVVELENCDIVSTSGNYKPDENEGDIHVFH